MQWIKTKLCTPIFFQQALKRWLHWQLGRNPIGWLEQRSWVGRLVVWSWFAVVVCIYSSLFSNLSVFQRGFHDIQNFVAALLIGSLAFSAAGSFRRERESGMLELLLVSPIREWQILAGRLRGLWMQFLPAMVLLTAIWLYTATFLPREHVQASAKLSILVFCMSYASLPVIGLYFSLAAGNFISSIMWTMFCGIVIPAALGRIMVSLIDKLLVAWFGTSLFVFPSEPVVAEMLVTSFLRIGIAILLARALLTRLRFRRFSLEYRA